MLCSTCVSTRSFSGGSLKKYISGIKRVQETKPSNFWDLAIWWDPIIIWFRIPTVILKGGYDRILYLLRPLVTRIGCFVFVCKLNATMDFIWTSCLQKWKSSIMNFNLSCAKQITCVWSSALWYKVARIGPKILPHVWHGLTNPYKSPVEKPCARTSFKMQIQKYMSVRLRRLFDESCLPRN